MKATRVFQAIVGAVLLALSMAACGSSNPAADGPATQPAQPPADVLTPLVATVLDSPIPVRGSDGLIHVVYELQVLNASNRAVTITEVKTVGFTGEVLGTLQGRQLVERIIPVGAAGPAATDDPAAIATLDAGRTVMVLMDGTYPSREEVPDRFAHRLTTTLSPADPTSKLSGLYSSVIERTGEVTLGTGEPLTLAPHASWRPLARRDRLLRRIAASSRGAADRRPPRPVRALRHRLAPG